MPGNHTCSSSGGGSWYSFILISKVLASLYGFLARSHSSFDIASLVALSHSDFNLATCALCSLMASSLRPVIVPRAVTQAEWIWRLSDRGIFPLS